MILGDRGGRGIRTNWLIGMIRMEIPRHLEPSFFDGARRGKPYCEAVLLAFG